MTRRCRLRGRSETKKSTPPRRPAVADPPPAGEGEDVPQPLRTGDNSGPLAHSPSAQPPDPPRLSRASEKFRVALSPHPPNLPHPRPHLPPSSRHRPVVRAMGRRGGSLGARPHQPARSGRRREHRPFGPLRRCRAGGDRCARSIVRVGERDRRGACPSVGGIGRGG